MVTGMGDQDAVQRQGWIDTLKGIAIFLVVVGHVNANGGLIKNTIYAFHMPLFFFLSGFLLVPGRYAEFAAFIKRRISTRLVPYLFFYALSTVLFLVFLQVYMNFVAQAGVLDLTRLGARLRDTVIALFMANGEWLAKANRNTTTLWFLPCLFVTETAFFFLVRAVRDDRRTLGMALLLISVAGYLESRFVSLRLPWSLDTALTAVVFYGAGAMVKGHLETRGRTASGMGLKALAGFVCLSLCGIITSVNGRIDMNANSYGNYFLFYAAAFSGILACMLLASTLGTVRSAGYFGRHSIVLLWMNLAAIPIVIAGLGAFTALNTPATITPGNDLYALIVALFVMLLAVPVIEVIKYTFPRAAGSVQTAKEVG